jgi:starch phosphorylase
MKFMLNGAVTLGTMDGANVEIFERVGRDNIFIFGASAGEIDRMEIDNSYRPKDLFDHNEDIRAAVSRLVDGTLPGVAPDQFQDIYQSLLTGDYDRADRYFLLYDFDPDEPAWTKRAVLNTAGAGFFSADRTIDEYNRQIWGLRPI